MHSIITISGKAESGKDLTASIMKKKLDGIGKNTIIVHYADYLKFIASQYFQWDGEKDEKGRTLLQKIGTEMVRAKDSKFWVHSVIRLLFAIGDEYDYCIIPDARFPNEIDGLRGMGYDVVSIKMIRDGHQNKLSEAQRKHTSENVLNEYAFNYTIDNTGGMTDLTDDIDLVVRSIIQKGGL
jgi:hypothetical protein